MKKFRDKAKVVFWLTAIIFIFPKYVDTYEAQGPSYDCDNVAASSIEEMICMVKGLSAMDRRLAEVYAMATEKAVNEHPPILKAEQRGWIKGRNDCWKSDDRRRCVQNTYQLRIAELQAKYRFLNFRK